jgi:hypothetical protein
VPVYLLIYHWYGSAPLTGCRLWLLSCRSRPRDLALSLCCSEGQDSAQDSKHHARPRGRWRCLTRVDLRMDVNILAAF